MQHLIVFAGLHIHLLYVVALSLFLGVVVIGGVPSALHTPLMSGANAIHGVVLVGAVIVVLDANPGNPIDLGIGFCAVVLGALNVVGGFAVTNRMLGMFSTKKRRQQ
jgi:NAD(P) transhydrogenase subunit alpha